MIEHVESKDEVAKLAPSKAAPSKAEVAKAANRVKKALGVKLKVVQGGKSKLKPKGKVIKVRGHVVPLKKKIIIGEPGKCTKCGTKVPGKGRWCKPHYKERRKVQLKANNKVWHSRVKAGVAGHHKIYDGKLTRWAQKAPAEARAYAKAQASYGEQKGMEQVEQLAKTALKRLQ